MKNVTNAICCAFRGRSDGDWNNSKHEQRIEFGDNISNSITSVQKDCLLCEIYDKTDNYMKQEGKVELSKELQGKKFRIRKLTPRECFRLMDVDDADIDSIQAACISNSSQYKLAGNSIVVNVIFHLFRKMFVETGVDKGGEPQQLSFF